ATYMQAYIGNFGAPALQTAPPAASPQGTGLRPGDGQSPHVLGPGTPPDRPRRLARPRCLAPTCPGKRGAGGTAGSGPEMVPQGRSPGPRTQAIVSGRPPEPPGAG